MKGTTIRRRRQIRKGTEQFRILSTFRCAAKPMFDFFLFFWTKCKFSIRANKESRDRGIRIRKRVVRTR